MYSKKPIAATNEINGSIENKEIDKRTVLDLCAHMFHPRDLSGAHDLSATLEYNDMT